MLCWVAIFDCNWVAIEDCYQKAKLSRLKSLQNKVFQTISEKKLFLFYFTHFFLLMSKIEFLIEKKKKFRF